MASTVQHPEDVMAWFISGDKLAIVTIEGSDSTTHSALGDWKAVDESVTDGILIHYHGEPDAVSSITDTLDIDNTLHSAVVDFVIESLLVGKAAVTRDPQLAYLYLNLSKKYSKEFDEKVRRFGARKRDKVGGTRAIMLPDLT